MERFAYIQDLDPYRVGNFMVEMRGMFDNFTGTTRCLNRKRRKMSRVVL